MKSSKITPIKQRDASACGPTSIEMVLKYFDVPHTVADITKVTNYKKGGGIYNNQLVSVSQHYGLAGDFRSERIFPYQSYRP